MSITRRNLFQASVASLAAPILDPIEKLLPTKSHFRFVHFSDLHIQPELGAPRGVALSVDKILALSPRPDFILTGGDHVMDLLNVSRERADSQFAILREALKRLEMPIHGVIGNHDVFGWGSHGSTQSDVLYGKRMVEERFLGTPAYRSFNFAGWHFALLDGVQPEAKIGWRGAIDDAQLAWLDEDLRQAGNQPKIILTHFPVLTLFTQYTDGTTVAATDTLILSNGKEVQNLCHKHGVIAVLQGHTHVVEDCKYLETRYITGGAVCGDWWKGWRLGVHPEGFMVYDVTNTDLKSKYVSYGWNAKAYQPTVKVLTRSETGNLVQCS